MKADALMLNKKTVYKMEWSVQCIPKQYDEVLAKLKRQQTEIADLKIVEQFDAWNADQKVRKLQRQINSLGQYSRRQDIEM